MDGTLGFIRESVSADEPILVVLSAEKIAALRRDLGHDAGQRRVRGHGRGRAEPGSNHSGLARLSRRPRQAASGRCAGSASRSGPRRSAAELAECQRHEALLNVAFADPAFWLLCPYDTAALSEAVVEEARRNHPFVREHRVPDMSASFPGVDALAGPFDAPLPAPPADAAFVTFEERDLADIRTLVAAAALRAGLTEERTAEVGPRRARGGRQQHRSRPRTWHAGRMARPKLPWCVRCAIDGRVADPARRSRAARTQRRRRTRVVDRESAL